MQLGAESGSSALPELDWNVKDKYNTLISRSSGSSRSFQKFWAPWPLPEVSKKTYIQDLKILIGESLEIFAGSWCGKA